MGHAALAAQGGGQGWGRAGRGGGGSAGNETPGQLGTAGTAAFGIPLPALAPQRDGHRHHGHATPTLGQPVGQQGRGLLTGRDRGGGGAGSYCRAVVIGGAGRDRGCADGSPRAAGRVPRGGRHGRAKRKLLRTKPRWGWSNWCQPISPRKHEPSPREGTCPGTCAQRRHGSVRPHRCEESSAPPRGEFRPRGEPHRPQWELPRCRQGIPGTLRRPRLPAVGIPDASGTARWRETLHRHCRRASRWPPPYQATAAPGG